MKGKEYLKNKEVVADMRKKLLDQQVILTDCYHWKEVYEALRLEREEVFELMIQNLLIDPDKMRIFEELRRAENK